ncbi:RCC1 domain-containing protein [Pseudomonas haemolytica]|uniref:AIR9-like A9 domain-containing protein n=4 Tax=Pseudomonas TaxID=286 RepID=A0ABS1GL83_9PSED|nr:hypothetical protein [Pseudomonas haemolytica]MBK3457731.1 hypothetical protein [Pseudomonas haemolytica]
MKKPKPIPIHMIPEAKNVEIVGDVYVGATVRGSYTYESNGAGNEGLSEFFWHINGKPLLEEGQLDLKLHAADGGKYLQFSVIPVASDGTKGIEHFSATYEIRSGFQNISDEENEWCFLKQRGNFSFHVPEPSDRLFVSTGGVFALLHPPTGDMHLEGQRGWGLPVPAEIINFLKNNKAVKLFSSEVSFAALVPVGSSNQLLCWGDTVPLTLPPLRGIKSVYSTRSAFAVIYENPVGNSNRIAAIGPVGRAVSTVPDEIQAELLWDAPKAIYAADDAFAVLTQNGKVHAWGNFANGGGLHAAAIDRLKSMFIVRIVACATGFCAIADDGDFVTWGNAMISNVPIDRYEAILNDGGVGSVIAAENAFCAITKNRRRAVSWGTAAEGGTMSASALALASRGNIVLCRANRWAFLMANASGEAEAWGAALYGGAPLTAAVKSEIKAAFTIKKSAKDSCAFPGYPERPTHKGEVPRRHGNVTSRAIILEGNLSLYATDVSFFLLSRHDDGRTHAIVLHGYATHGAVMSGALRQTLMASLIRDVYCTNGAYGVIVTQGGTEGAVHVWGATLAMEDAGEIPPELAEHVRSGVVELYSIKRFPYVRRPDPPPPPPRPPPPPPPRPPQPVWPPPTPPHIDPSFAARRTDGTYVLWGGNVRNQYFDPGAEDKK